MERVFKNAMLYNPAGTPVHVFASKALEQLPKMHQSFEEDLAKVADKRLGYPLAKLRDSAQLRPTSASLVVVRVPQRHSVSRVCRAVTSGTTSNTERLPFGG